MAGSDRNGLARRVEAALPPRLFIPLAQPSLNASMDLTNLQAAMERSVPIESAASLRPGLLLRLAVMVAALAVAGIKTVAPGALAFLPGTGVILLLLAGVFAAHGRHGEFWMASSGLWRRTGYYAAIIGLALAVFAVPAGYPTTLATTAFLYVVLIPPLSGALHCLKHPGHAALARQIARYEAALSPGERSAFHTRLRHAAEAL